jgi:desulfoferrodoxin (superoxide reductase-like protein)
MLKKVQTLLLIACVLASGTALAHPPSAIKLAYDKTQHMLQITVMHDTKKPNEHYIKTIVVRINGKEVIRQDYTKQPDIQKRGASYLLEDVVAGDEISAEGQCNIYGKKKESIQL